MRLCQDEILSLLFISTGIRNNVSMKQIQEFLKLYTKNGKEDEEYQFYMPMHDDFDIGLFKENDDTGDFYVVNPNSELCICKIKKVVLNVIKKDKTSNRTINTIREYKKIYNNRKMVEDKKNNENSIQKIKKIIFRSN